MTVATKVVITTVARGFVTYPGVHPERLDDRHRYQEGHVGTGQQTLHTWKRRREVGVEGQIIR